MEIKYYFENSLSKLAIDELKQLKGGNDYVYLDSTESSTFVTELFKRTYPNELNLALKSIVLELVAITRNIDSENLRSKLTTMDVKRIIHNINYACDELFKYSRTTYLLISELRLIQRSLYYLLDSEIFSETLKSKIESLNSISNRG